MKTLDDKIEELNVKEQHKIKHIFTPNTNKNGTVQCRYYQLDFAYKGNSVVIYILVKCEQNLLLMVIVHNWFVAKDIQNTAEISCNKSVFGVKIVNIFIKNKLLPQ